jgi:hypothetical protein
MTSAGNARQQRLADQMIRKYGTPAILRRDGGDRSCWAFISDYSPHERMGKLVNQTDRKALISPIGLTADPDSEQDRLVTLDPATGTELETLRIIAPIGKLAPAQIVLYWELQVRR